MEKIILSEIVFNKIYKKYHAKDYFYDKKILRDKITWAKGQGVKYNLWDIKIYLKKQRKKLYTFLVEKRIPEMLEGVNIPQREKLSHEVFNYYKNSILPEGVK